MKNKILTLACFLLIMPLILRGQAWAEITKFCPPVGNQGQTNSCTGWAVSNAYSMAFARQQDSIRLFSAYFGFNKATDNNCTNSTNVYNLLTELKKTGICTAQYLSNDTSRCGIKLSGNELQEAERDAKNYKIKDIDLITDCKSIGDTIGDKIGDKIIEWFKDTTRAIVLDIKLPTVGFNAFKVGSAEMDTSIWQPDRDDFDTSGTSHALAFVCFLEVSQTVILMNSWGENWGHKGFIRMRKKHLFHCLNGVYSFKIHISKDKLVQPVEIPPLWSLPHYNSRLFNPALINSASAEYQQFSVDATVRRQYTNFGDAAPVTTLIKGEWLMKDRYKAFTRLVLGFQFNQDKIGGYETNTSTLRAGLRTVSNKKGGASLVLSGSSRELRLNTQSLYFRQANDPFAQQASQTVRDFSVGFGWFGYFFLPTKDKNAATLFGGLSFVEIGGKQNLSDYPIDALIGYQMSCRRLGYLTNSLWVRYTKPLPMYWDARVRWQMPKSCFWLGGGYTSTGIGRFEFYVLSKCLGKHTQLVLGVAAEHNFSPYLGGIGPTAEGNLGGYFVR